MPVKDRRPEDQILKGENLNYKTGRILIRSRVPKIEEKLIIVKRRVGFSFLGLEIDMKKFIVFILTLCLISGIAYGKGYEVKKRAGEYEAEVKIDRSPPVVGDNNIEIEIKDAVGKRVTEAKVLVNYYMPPMPRMAPMNYTTDAKLKGEKYKAKMNFIMSGPWVIAIKISHAGKISTTKFNVDAQ